MIDFCVILTLVCSLRACHVSLTRNHMFIREIWGKFSSFIFWDFEISPEISLLIMWLLVLIVLSYGAAFKVMYEHAIADKGLFPMASWEFSIRCIPSFVMRILVIRDIANFKKIMLLNIYLDVHRSNTSSWCKHIYLNFKNLA